MGKLYVDAEVTYEKLKAMELAFGTDAKYLFQGRGYQGIIVDGEQKAIAYLSLFPIAGKNYACFLIPTIHIKDHGFEIARLIRQLLDAHLNHLEWETVQTVSKDDKIINRWMKFMAFEKIDKIEVPNQEGAYYLWRRFNHGG